MNKRGISPLITLVLIIAFALGLFLIISSWVQKEVIQPSMDKTEKIATSLECMGARLDIIEACNEGNKIKIEMDNLGDINLEGIQIRVIGDDVELISIDEKINSLDRFKTEKEVAIGDIKEVEIYPKIKAGVCKTNPFKKEIKEC